MLCGGFYPIFGFSVRDTYAPPSFLSCPPEGQPLAFALNLTQIRQASPCVVLIPLEQQQQFYTAPSCLYPTIPHSTLKVLLQTPLAESSPISPIPRPHTSGKHHIHSSTFPFGSRRSQQPTNGKVTHMLRNPSLGPSILGNGQYD